jgi:hypothetical protein
MQTNIKIFSIIFIGIFIFKYSNAQCPEYYSIINDTTISILAAEPEYYFLKDNIYEDHILGKIQIDVLPGIFLYFNRNSFIFQYDLIFNVLINQYNDYNYFKPSWLNVEFDDHTGFILETDTQVLSLTRDILRIDIISFYMNPKTYTFLINKNIYKISVIDESHDKLINIFPNQQSIKTQARCISYKVPYEVNVEYYNHVIDSLLKVRKYGKLGY